MDKKAIDKAQLALEQGFTQKEAAAEADIPLRTFTRLIQRGELRPLRRRRRSSVQVEDSPGAEYRRLWSAADLEGIYKSNKVTSIQLTLETEARRGNWRLHEWIGRVREVHHIPSEWRAAIAFLPILARDIDAPALATVADVMRSEVPWTNKEMRRRYRRKVAPFMDRALSEIGRWSAGFGLVPYYKQRGNNSPPEFVGIADITDFPLDPHDKGLVEKFRDSLFGTLIDLVGRLPDVERPNGPPFVRARRSLLRPLSSRRVSITMLAAGWCLTADDQWVERVRNARSNVRPEVHEEE